MIQFGWLLSMNVLLILVIAIMTITSIYAFGDFTVGLVGGVALIIFAGISGYIQEWIMWLTVLAVGGGFVYVVVLPMFGAGGGTENG